jgi:ribosomal protein S21
MKVIRKGREPVQFMCKKLKKLLMRNGVIREMRNHEHYLKPSEKRRQKESRRLQTLKKLKEPPSKNNHHHAAVNSDGRWEF